MQQTIAKELKIEGEGLHSGKKSTLIIKPADVNTGIVFIRTDINDANPIPAIYTNVINTKNCTCIGHNETNIVSTIEHLMAALYMMQIDNAIVEINAPEMPILDGAAQTFFKKMQEIGVIRQNSPRKYIKVLKKVSIADDKGNTISLDPSENFHVNFVIEFPSKVVGRQEFDGDINQEIFIKEIAPCRTFCEKYQIDYLRSIGLIKGGSLENSVVLDGENILNPEGFKVKNECVNHKVLDAIGDMYTAGYPIKGKLTAKRTGHFHNNQILQTLFADSSNYIIEEE